MKKTCILLLLFVSIQTDAQFNELDFGLGFATYYGDLNIVNKRRASVTALNEAFDFKSYKFSYSLGYRYNFKKFLSIGLYYYHMTLTGYDSDNKQTTSSENEFYRKLRNLSFYTPVDEVFIDFRLEPFRTLKKWRNVESVLVSPYVGAGAGFFKFSPRTKYNDVEYDLQPLGTEGQGLPGYGNKYNLGEIVIPVNVGLKVYMPKRNLAISIDFNYNHTFTDYIDDVSTVYPNPVDLNTGYASDPAKLALIKALANRNIYGENSEYSSITGPGQQRGDPSHYDFFVTGQLKFSYNFYYVLRKNHYKCYDF